MAQDRPAVETAALQTKPAFAGSKASRLHGAVGSRVLSPRRRALFVEPRFQPPGEEQWPAIFRLRGGPKSGRTRLVNLTEPIVSITNDFAMALNGAEQQRSRR